MHNLRHSIVTLLFQYGTNLIQQEHLGQRSMKKSELFTHICTKGITCKTGSLDFVLIKNEHVLINEI